MADVDPEVPKGSYAAGRRVRLPRGADEPIRVHVNGVERARDIDYKLDDGEIIATNSAPNAGIGFRA